MVEKERKRPFLYFDEDFVPNLRKRVRNAWINNIYKDMMETTEADFTLSEKNPFMLDREELKKRYPGEEGEQAKFLSHDGAARLIRLALLYLITGDTKYAERCKDFLDIYMKQRWIYPLETDLILSSWLLGFSTSFDWIYHTGVLGNEQNRNGLAYRLRDRIWMSCDWLMDYLQKGGIPDPGNHNLIVACTLSIASLGFPGHSQAKIWFDYGKKLVDNYLITGDKLGEDGDWYEGTLRYQSYPLVWFFFYADACRQAGVYNYYKLSKIRKMFDVILYYLTPNGENLGFNDVTHTEISKVSGGLLIKGASEYKDGGYIWAFNNIKNKDLSFPLSREQIILYYDQERIPQPCKPDLPPSTLLRRTGYGIFRTGWEKDATLFAMDCGPYCVHDHVDKGTFEFYYEGIPLILDSGCGRYAERRKWVSPQMHNIVVVNGGYQYKYEHPIYGYGAWDLRLPFDGEIIEYHLGKNVCFLKGDYTKQSGVERATRSVMFLKPGYLIILDELKDKKENVYEAYFHGRGKVKLRQDQGVIKWETTESVDLFLRIIAPNTYDIETGTHEFALQSRLDGLELHGKPVRSRENSTLDYVNIKTVGKDVRYLNLLLPIKRNGESLKVKSSILETGERIEVNSEDFTDTFIFQKIPKFIKTGNVITDAKICFIRIKKHKPVEWMIHRGTHLEWNNHILIKSPIITTFMSFTK